MHGGENRGRLRRDIVEQPIALSAPDGLRENLDLDVVEFADHIVEHARLRIGARIVDQNLDEAPDVRSQLHMHLEPIVDQVDGLGVLAGDLGVIAHGRADGFFERGAEQRFLVGEVVVEQRRVDLRELRNVFDGDRRVIALGEQLQGRRQDLLPSYEAIFMPGGFRLLPAAPF